MIAVGFMMNARSVSDEEIKACNDIVCMQSINKQIANEELQNNTNTTNNHGQHRIMTLQDLP